MSKLVVGSRGASVPAARTAILVLAIAALVSATFATPSFADHGSGSQGQLTGVVSSLPPAPYVGDWVVGTTTVHVTATTQINDPSSALAVGVTVEVKGTLESDGSITATRINVESTTPEPTETHFTGVVQSLPSGGFVGDWVVDTTTVHVTATTTIDQNGGTIAVGSTVRVEGTVEADGSVDAQSIELVTGSPGNGGTHNNQPPQSMIIAVLHLVPSAAAPTGAEGVVVTRMFDYADGTNDQDLKVSVEGLAPNAVYEAIIDGIDAGPIMTDAEGEGSLFLSTRNIPGAQPLPPELQPVTGLGHIDVIDSSTTVILSGDFVNATHHDQAHPGTDTFSLALLRGSAPSVMGMAVARSDGTEQTLDIRVWHLTPSTMYSVVVDGVGVGTLTTDLNGELVGLYSNPMEAGGMLLPDALLPVSGLLHVEIQASDGTVVASGDFMVVHQDSPSGHSSTAPRAHLGGH
jgi:Domain of unknown function (DUF5666)